MTQTDTSGQRHALLSTCMRISQDFTYDWPTNATKSSMHSQQFSTYVLRGLHQNPGPGVLHQGRRSAIHIRIYIGTTEANGRWHWQWGPHYALDNVKWLGFGSACRLACTCTCAPQCFLAAMAERPLDANSAAGDLGVSACY